MTEADTTVLAGARGCWSSGGVSGEVSSCEAATGATDVAPRSGCSAVARRSKASPVGMAPARLARSGTAGGRSSPLGLVPGLGGGPRGFGPVRGGCAAFPATGMPVIKRE